jgi:hypothetical protein
MPDRGQPDSFVRGLAPFGNAAVPAAEFYFAAEDQLAAVGELTVVSRDMLSRLQLTSKVRRTVPAVAAFMLGYAARLSAEAAGAEPVVNRDDLPPLESGIAGPKPSSVQDHSKDIMHFAAGLAGRIAELIGVPEPVWQGFVRAVAVQLAERYGRAGRKVAAEAGQLVIIGYLARVIDQGYGLPPAGTASQRRPTRRSAGA